MSFALSGTTAPLRWAAAGRPASGEGVSGDRHVVCGGPRSALIAVIDGLGHGAEAADAAARAAEVVVRAAESPHLASIFHACHDELARTRGAVMSLARASDGRLDWLAVGNVEGLVVRGPLAAGGKRQRLSGAGGVVGHALPSLHPSTLPLHVGDLVVLATDGLRAAALDDVSALATPEGLVRELLLRHADGRDDALVLAARIDGAAT